MFDDRDRASGEGANPRALRAIIARYFLGPAYDCFGWSTHLTALFSSKCARASPRPSIGEASELGGVDCKRPWQPHHKVTLFRKAG